MTSPAAMNRSSSIASNIPVNQIPRRAHRLAEQELAGFLIEADDVGKGAPNIDGNADHSALLALQPVSMSHAGCVSHRTRPGCDCATARSAGTPHSCEPSTASMTAEPLPQPGLVGAFGVDLGLPRSPAGRIDGRHEAQAGKRQMRIAHGKRARDRPRLSQLRCVDGTEHLRFLAAEGVEPQPRLR